MIHSLIREDCTMKRIFIFAAMAAISLTACQQELNIDENKPETHAVFTATTESSITKTAALFEGTPSRGWHVTSVLMVSFHCSKKL